MRFVDWLRHHRAGITGGVAGTVIGSLVATAAVVSIGYTAQKLSLGDGTVWVANTGKQVVGRANPAVYELNAVVATQALQPVVVQEGGTVLVVDEVEASLDVIHPATAELGERVALPPDQPRVYAAAGRIIIHEVGTGDVWILPADQLEDFDAATSPQLSLGADVSLSVSPAGVLAAVSPVLGEVDLLDITRSSVVEQRWQIATDAAAVPGRYQITTVGGKWLVLDVTARTVTTEAGVVSLAGMIPEGASPTLQRASDGGRYALVAWNGGLAAVPPDGSPMVLADDLAGTPAEPVSVDGCDFAAWSSGSVWRRCGVAEERLDTEGLAAGASLDFAVNGDHVVLNDTAAGASWAVQDAAQRIDNWDQLIVPDDDQQQPDNDPGDEPDVDPQQKPPVAVADQFGARPGRATVLPVLLNDYDPNADVLVITQVGTIPETVGRIDIVTRRQQLQLTLEPSASGTISFSYSIDDGRGGSASATVTVTVRGDRENSPPVQVRESSAIVREGGRVTTNVLGDWVDPDGDPFYLASAVVSGGSQVSYKPDGVIVYTDLTGESTGVVLTMTDGHDNGGGLLRVEVRPSGEVPIVIEPWAVLATAGEDITIHPLNHLRGGSGVIRLNAVPARAGATITPSFETGTFVFSSERVGAHYVSFTVTDGDLVQDGVVRIDVQSAADPGSRPVTVPQTIFVRSLSSATIDPTRTDFDPAGGVLVVTGVTDVPAASGIRTEVIGQRDVRVTLTEPLPEPVELHYRVSNGISEAEGTIRVVEIPRPARVQPPIAVDDSITVRVGAVVDIPVLDNDEQPDGGTLSLLPDLAENLPDNGGLLFVAGDRLRYLAPQAAGNYTAVYTVESGGQRSDARVRISVREVDAESNAAPIPELVTARVLAGETVTIDIPLSGIDPDGDTVQLIGVASSPAKGIVNVLDSGRIDYTAGDYSTGTDEFSYTVVDSLGARSEGRVRVGISPRLEGARNPVANGDEVRVRPGRTISVRVLENDTDPDGTPLRVTTVRPNSTDTTAEIVDDEVVVIDPPDAAGIYSVSYTIANATGGTSSAFVTVDVDPEAPISAPIVSDTVLTINDVIDKTTIDVDVLAHVFWSDGAVGELAVGLVSGYSQGAEVLPSKRIRATIQDLSQIIPFSVSLPGDPTVRGTAFLWVPGREDALPQLDRTAPPLVVESEQPLTIDLNDYVIALGGQGVRLVDQASVQATHANGANLVIDDDTLEFTSADRYFGPASVTFEVTDGASANDPNGRRAILTLPITVEPRENTPPVFRGGVIDFEPGQSKELDLVRLTDYPYDDDLDELAYTILDPLPEGFTLRLNGQRLVITANPDAVKGSRVVASLGVRDAINEGVPGRIDLGVVASTRPLVQTISDRAVVPRGATTTVDVLANDEANNPFPETPLRVIAIRGIDAASLPPGVAITPSADSSTLQVTVAESAEPLDTTLQYQVADASGDPDRYVWGTVTVSVQDVPDAVTDVRVTEFGDRSLKLSWTPGAANNSPIDHYEVRVQRADSGEQIGSTNCATTAGCSIPTPGNGPSNAVRLAVVAVNAIGASDPALNAQGAIWSDVIPPAPASVSASPLDHGLRISWRKPDAGSAGSPIDRYVVTVGAEVRTYQPSSLPGDPVGTLYSLDISGIPSLANGSSVSYSVSARNAAPTSLASWNQAGGTAVPAWTPIRVGSPTASGVTDPDGTVVAVAWPGVFDPNGRAISDYRVGISSNGSTPQWWQSTSVGTATTRTLTGLTPNTQYTVVVYASNGLGGWSEAATASVTPRARPATVTAISTSLTATSESTWDVRVDSVTTAAGGESSFRYRFQSPGVDGSTSDIVSVGARLTTGNGSHYGVAGQVQVQACVVYPEVTLCSSDWSAAFDIGTPVSSPTPGLLTATLNETPDTGGVWSWQSSPSAPGYSAVFYSCSEGADWVQLSPQGGPGSCTTPEAVGTPSPLIIRIQTASGQYDRSFAWNDFDAE